MNAPDPLDAALQYIWIAALDWQNSPDFQSLPDDERDASYIRYQSNIVNRAKKLITQANLQAVEAFAEKLKDAWPPELAEEHKDGSKTLKIPNLAVIDQQLKKLREESGK